jgi:hypothetical protein
MKFTVIYFDYGTMGEINISKSNTTNGNITATNANSFVLPTLTILYVCPFTVPDILSYPTLKSTPFTKLDLKVNCSCLLVWAILGTQVQGQGKKYCLSLLVQEILSQRSEMWNDNINIQLHNKSLSNAKLYDVWNSEAYVRKHCARPVFLKLFWSGDHFYKSEQFCGPPYCCSLRQQIYYFFSIF